MSDKSRCLVNSIRRVYPEAPILSYVTEAERPGLDMETTEFFESRTTVRTGGFPVSGYPISAKLRAMTLAAEAFEFEHLVFLDSDTVLLDSFDAFLDSAPPADIYAKPVDISGKWDTEAQWYPVVAATGYEMPGRRTVSTVDRRRILPFYNAGVVITTDRSFPAKWLALTVAVYDAIEAGNPIFADQIALGLLTQRYDLVELTELENYPLHLYSTLSRDAVLVHYHHYSALTKIRDRDFVDILVETGLYDRIPEKARLVSCFYEPMYRERNSRVNDAATLLKQEDIMTLLRGARSAVADITARL